MLPVRVFRSFIINALPPQGRETLDKFVFINWISEKSIIKKKACKSYSSLVAFLAACLTSWQHQLRALFELTEEMFTKTAGDRRQFMIEKLHILLWIICQIELLSNSK